MPLSALATRKRLKKLCEKEESPLQTIGDAILRHSKLLECVEGGVRRVIALPPPRGIVCSGYQPGSARLRPPGGSDDTFTIMSYNILADHLATNRMFPHATPEAAFCFFQISPFFWIETRIP